MLASPLSKKEDRHCFTSPRQFKTFRQKENDRRRSRLQAMRELRISEIANYHVEEGGHPLEESNHKRNLTKAEIYDEGNVQKEHNNS